MQRVPFTFPEFEVLISGGLLLNRASFPSSSLSYEGAYGQTAVYTLTIAGDSAFMLRNSGALGIGLRMAEVYGGYRFDEMPLLAQNLIIWEAAYSSDSESGQTLTVTAYGCSQLLRQSGQRTERLAAKTYAQAAREIAGRWGLKIRIGPGAYMPLPEKTDAEAERIANLPSSVAGPNTQGNTRVALEAQKVANGQRIPSLTDDTLSQTGLCFRLVRQVVERGLGLGVGQWEVARLAERLAQNDGDRVEERHANNAYEASRRLGLLKSGPIQPGDILFQPDALPQPEGHVGIYLGNNLVLENTTAIRGSVVLGSAIRVTPLAQFGAYQAAYPLPLERSEKATPPASQPTTLARTAGVTVTSNSTENEQAAVNRRVILQENETDWELLSKLGADIGYIVSETELGDELYFGPGLEIGSRDRYILVHGEYRHGQQDIPANVSGVSSSTTLYGIPAEVVVTGIEKGKRFSLIVTPDQLADRQRVRLEENQTQQAERGNFRTSTPAVLIQTDSVTVSASSSQPEGTLGPTEESGKVVTEGAADFAGRKVAALLRGAYPTARRLVLGGASSRADAWQRGLEALALENLRFQEVQVTMFGIPQIKPGHEVVLVGSKVPASDSGLYLVRTVGGEMSGEGGYSMTLTLVRNTA